MTSLPLAGRTVLVTGAAGGIGGAVVTRFAEAGAHVIATDLACPSIGDKAFAADLTDEAALAAGLNGDEPDIVAHAGAASVFGGILDTDPESFARLYDVNVVSTVRLMQLCVPAMRRAGRGAFVLLSSINADFGTPTLAAYAATKGALNALTKTAALEFAEFGIRVNAIAPASIDTPLLRAGFDQADDPAAAKFKNVARHPLGRLGEPEEVAALALFLASDDAGWITGGVFPIDGGAHVARR